ELFDDFGHFAATTHTRGVDERVAAAAAVEIEIDRIAPGAPLPEGDHALLSEERIDQGRLADVGAADDRHENTLTLIGVRLVVRRRRAHGQRMLRDVAHLLPRL